MQLINTVQQSFKMLVIIIYFGHEQIDISLIMIKNFNVVHFE